MYVCKILADKAKLLKMDEGIMRNVKKISKAKNREAALLVA